MSMTMGGSARALALLVWLAAIPIAAHAAAEASFEVSQNENLGLLMNFYRTPTTKPWDGVDNAPIPSAAVATKMHVAAAATATTAATAATVASRVAASTRSRRPTFHWATQRTSTGSLQAFGTLAATGILRASASQPFPTSLPTATTAIDYGTAGYTGTLPTQVGYLTDITEFYMPRNTLTGVLPTQLGQLEKAEKFMVYSNRFTGAPPTELGNMTALTSNFYLNSNSLSSTIPTEFGRILQTLTGRFKLQSNQLCDDVPTQVSALSNNVDQFYVQTSNSIGTFCDWPEEVYNRFSGSGGKDTVSVSYSNYQITGTIPTEFGLMTEATSFAMSTNYLRGPIPTQLGMLSLVVNDMQLFDNDLTSALPTELGNLDLIETGFELYSLSLNGTVPTELGRFTEMSRSFELDENSFSGPIPTQLGSMTKMAFSFSLTSNRFCDDVPTELQLLSSGVNNWDVTTGNNNIGTDCCEIMSADWLSCSSAPTMTPLPTSTPTTPPPTMSPTKDCPAGYYLTDANTCDACDYGTYRSDSDTDQSTCNGEWARVGVRVRVRVRSGSGIGFLQGHVCSSGVRAGVRFRIRVCIRVRARQA